MSEKATVFQGVQIGVETTPGTAVPANKKLKSVSIIPQPRAEGDPFRALGDKYASFVSLNKEYAALSIEGKPTYTELPYLLSGFLHYSAPVQQASTTAYKWTFTSNTSAEDIGKTFTIEQGDTNNAWRVKGGKIAGLTFDFNRNEVKVSGDGIASKFEEDVTITPSPTALNPVPVLPTHVKLYMADTHAGLTGATAMTRGFSISYSLTNKFGLAWPLGQDPIAVEGAPNADARIRMATNTEGMSIFSALRTSQTEWIRIVAEGETIETTYKYKLSITFPAQVSGLGDFADHENVYTIEAGLTPIHDATWGKSVEIELITDLNQL